VRSDFSPNLSQSKLSVVVVLSAIFLAVIGIILGFSVLAALFDLGGFLSGPGYFFVRYYGFLALFIPVYLVCASFLLIDPCYRPNRIFILALVTVPFVTLGLGIFWIRNFDELALKSVFFFRAGKTGIGFLTAIITVIEALLIAFFYSMLFSYNGKFAWAARISNVLKRFAFSKKKTPVKPAGLLPWPRIKPRKSLNDIYTESAAAGLGLDLPEAAYDEINNPEAFGEETAEFYPEPPDHAGTDDAQADDMSAKPAEKSDESGVMVKSVFPDVEEALAAAAEAAARHNPEPVPQNRKRKLRPYSVPVEGILNQYPDGEYWVIDDATRSSALILKETLKEFKIQAEVTGIKKGPVITMFEILPAPGVKLSRIVNLQDNIALRLAASSVRIVAPIPGKHAVGIEVPNAKRNIVSFREIIDGELYREGKRPEIPVVLGKDITGDAITADLVAMPHLLIAGATGSGKSVCVNSMILSILYQKPPSDCRLILIDPKIVELKLYNGIGHLLTPVITEPKRAFQALQYCIYEMERRYACLDSLGVRDIRSYNKRLKERDVIGEYMPYIVVIIDEFADLMATTGKELESTVARLAAMSRAVGIHLVLATQRPSIDVITGLIKANIPSRIAFMVAGRMNSQIIIDAPGAEKLLGKGDMLYAGVVDPFPVRMQGAFVSEEEVERVVDYVKGLGEPDYIDDEIFFDDDEEEAEASLFSEGDDPLYDKALEIVMQQGKASASYIQRRLKIGYNRSARLVEEMERHGVVGPAQGSKPRELLRH
jgi:S-DNA-T family DNA segregation ATPase FtsK/SpoIIIE